MAKFDLKAAKTAANKTRPVENGYYHTKIIQVAEVGLQPGFGPTDEPKHSTGFAFKLLDGRIVTKVMTHSASAFSWMGKLAAALPEVDEIKDFLGQTVDLEVESNGNWPKIVGFYPPDEGLAEQGPFPDAEFLLYDADEPDPATLKKLHRDLRSAVSRRIRLKTEGDL